MLPLLSFWVALNLHCNRVMQNNRVIHCNRAQGHAEVVSPCNFMDAMQYQ